jgi:tRNA pseudouridine55 synthase
MLSGILNVDKPSGPTSHEVVVAVRRLSRQRKVGHAGTLDPLATGVLLVCLGNATRVSEYLMDSTKGYRATIRLGISTTTHDAEGEITGRAEVRVTRQQVEHALLQFNQVPPMHSAIKHHGTKLYELARQGIAVDVPPRPVEFHRVQLIEWAPPVITVEIECGPGTYIRALARDLGEALGCGAHLAALCRTRSGRFKVDQAISLEQLEKAFANGQEGELIYPLDRALDHLPALFLDAQTARRLAFGQSIQVSQEPPDVLAAHKDRACACQARAYGPGRQFVALVVRNQDGQAWKPHKVFAHPAEIA